MKTFIALVCAAVLVIVTACVTIASVKADVTAACKDQGWYVLHKVNPDTLKGGDIIFCAYRTSEEVEGMTGEIIPSTPIKPEYKPTMTFKPETLAFEERYPYNEFPDWYENHYPDDALCASDPDDLLDLQECP